MALLLLIAGFVAACGAQDVPPQPADQPQAPLTTLRANVRRVSVDVVVMDAKGHPVKGFQSSDFKVFEDGTLQQIRSFDAHTLNTQAASTLADSVTLPPNTFANLVRAPDGAPVVVLLYDVLNTPSTVMPYAHDAMVKFIKSQKAGSRIAIFVLSSRLRMLQGFTDDETRLLSVLNSKASRSQQSSLLLSSDSTQVTGTDPLADAPPVSVNGSLADLKSLESSENALMLEERLLVTEDAFAEIAHFLAPLPGRKSLIWMSGSFPSSLLPNSDPAASGTANAFGDAFQYDALMKRTNDLLTASHVSVYPVDVRGLEVNPAFSAGSVKGQGTRPTIQGNPNETAERGTMDTIAEGTGGRAFYNTNGLLQAMQIAMDEGSSYYTITYAPTNPRYDGTLRKIKVQLSQSGFQLSYRRSYFADDLAHPPATASGTAGSSTAAQDILLDSGMQHGAPISGELFFETRVVPVGAVMPASAHELEQLSQFMKTSTKARKNQDLQAAQKVQHYRVEYVILGRALKLPSTGDGKYRTDMVFGLAAYSPDSLIVNGVQVSVKNELPVAQYDKIRTKGYHAGLDFVAPVEATALRIAVRDVIGNKMGTVEVPLPLHSPPPGAPIPKPAPDLPQP